MTENKYSLKTSSSEDDEFVCDMCNITVDKNDKKFALSECFNKSHFICPPCVQSLVATDGSKDCWTESSCPLCVLSERLNERNEQLWCSQCNIPASLACYEDIHIIQNYDDLFNALSLQLKLQINQTNSACDHTLMKCRQIQSVHQVILTWMKWLHLEISQWDSANNATVAQLESLKMSEGYHVPQEKDPQCSINKMNQFIAQFNDRFQEAQASQLKVIQLFQTYSECTNQQELTPSAQTPNVESTELLKWFSTSFNQTNQSCINVLAFLISLLRKDDKKIKEEEQDSNDLSGEATIRLKRRAEEDQESSRVISKKARNENSRRFEKDLSCDLSSRNNADNLVFKEEKEFHYSEENENHAEQTFSDQLFEERATELDKEAEQNTDVPSRIARLEADLEFMAKQIKRAKESEAKARKETLNQIERAKRTEEKYEMELKQHSTDVKQLKAAHEQLAQSRSQLANVLRQLSNRTTPDLVEKLQRDKKLLEKRLEQVQTEMDEINEALQKSTIHVMRVNSDSASLQIKLQEEVRSAKEESLQLKTKLAETMAKHLNELHRFRNYKTQFEELKIEFDKLILEKEQCSADLAAFKAAQINDRESLKNKAELEKANPKIVKQEMDHLCLSSTKQQIAPVVANQQPPAAQHVTSNLTPQQIFLQNLTKENNVQNVVVPNVGKPKHLQIFNFNAIATVMLAEIHNNYRDFDQFVYPCDNCKWPVETGFYCSECEDFKLCFHCHKKDGHCHKMEKFGFELDRNKSSNHLKDVTEDRKSRIDRRVLSFVHSFYCTIDYCLEPFCRTMKEVVAHNLACHAKTSIGEVKGSPKLQTRCLVCRQLVGLIISHAKHCTDPECLKPHCSNVKKRIKNALFKHNLLKSKNVIPTAKKLGNANLEPLGSRNKNPNPINATKASSANLSKTDLSKKQLPDKSTADDFPLAVHNVIEAPTSSGSVDSGIEISNPSAITYEENLKLVQDNVALIIHAHKCMQGVNQANETCPIPYCLKMKDVLNHVRSCQNGQSCQVPHCSNSKKIISHWRNCCRSDCPFCARLRASDHYNVTVGSHSSGLGAVALTVKSNEALFGTQAPTKSADQLSRPTPFQQLNPIAQMKNVQPVTSAGNDSHVAKQTQDRGDNPRVAEDAAITSDSMDCPSNLQEMGKKFVKPLQLNVLLPARVLHPPPVNNPLTSQNVTVDGGTQVNPAVHPVGAAKKNVDTSMSADGEKRKIPQKPVNSVPQQPLSGKTMHLGLAIAMGSGICCPVGAMNRKALAQLLLDPKPFGCKFRSTLKELLMKMKSPNVAEETRQRIAIFFGINYLFVCSFFRKQSQQGGS